MTQKALVIFSGGQDSTTCLGWAKRKFDEVIAITFKYGQKHEIEIEKSKEICKMLNVTQNIIDISFFGQLVDSALTSNGDVNKKHDRLTDLPASFVPNRNAMFITISHAVAQKLGCQHLVTGVCQTDYSGYCDCRQEFITSIQETLNLGTYGNKNGLTIHTPLMNLTKAETFELAEKNNILNVVIHNSHTCYNGDQTHHSWGNGCDKCPACDLRRKGWEEYVQSLNI